MPDSRVGKYANYPNPRKRYSPISTMLNFDLISTGDYGPIRNFRRFECDAGEPAVSGRTIYIGFKQLNFSHRLLFYRHHAHHYIYITVY